MKNTKWISKILYLITRGLAWIYFFTAIYGTTSWVSKTNIQNFEDKAIINYPFTDTSFLILDDNLSYFVFAFLLPILAYSLFFWLLSSVFKVFFQDRLFTHENVIYLKRFYVTNIVFPTVLIAFSSFFIAIEKGIFMLVALHLFLGVFVFIISEIFNQGLTLQNEQDLYI